MSLRLLSWSLDDQEKTMLLICITILRYPKSQTISSLVSPCPYNIHTLSSPIWMLPSLRLLPLQACPSPPSGGPRVTSTPSRSRSTASATTARTWRSTRPTWRSTTRRRRSSSSRSSSSRPGWRGALPGAWPRAAAWAARTTRHAPPPSDSSAPQVRQPPPGSLPLRFLPRYLIWYSWQAGAYLSWRRRAEGGSEGANTQTVWWSAAEARMYPLVTPTPRITVSLDHVGRFYLIWFLLRSEW